MNENCESLKKTIEVPTIPNLIKKKSHRFRNFIKTFVLVVAISLGSILSLLFYSEVDNSLTAQDLFIVTKILNEYRIKSIQGNSSSFEEQINFIRSVQLAVLAVAPINHGIPEGERRSPYILYTLKHGLCYDRSRTIEKVLRANNFKTRHIYIYPCKDGQIIRSIFTKNLSSHAVTEVETSKGWLVVDSNFPWISVTKSARPIGIDNIFSIYKSNKDYEFLYNEFNKENIYKNEFGYVYGLYSRHGNFYPPYNFIPDINWKEFAQNF